MGLEHIIDMTGADIDSRFRSIWYHDPGSHDRYSTYESNYQDIYLSNHGGKVRITGVDRTVGNGLGHLDDKENWILYGETEPDRNPVIILAVKDSNIIKPGNLKKADIDAILKERNPMMRIYEWLIGEKVMEHHIFGDHAQMAVYAYNSNISKGDFKNPIYNNISL
ncbi:MAG: hypothetical protein KKF44_04675 [Nanoarchaeota archaeon]|nr:hypothetical protein [Nanoarchaeota archaeon]